MIADRSTGVVVKSTMGGESYSAGVDDGDMPWLIGLFTNLYSDTELACLREYSTNARDAMIEAGVDGPVEVTLPSALSPFLTIVDRGVGMNEDTIRTVYSRYGRSTKRDSNDYNGMLGLGCKSALSYAHNFTVESNKDGVKTLCSISKVENGVPQFQVVASGPTQDPNGTTVRIPTQRYNDFEAKAERLFRFWPEGSVLVNGSQPKHFKGLDLGTRNISVEWGTYCMDITVQLRVSAMKELSRNMVVMGGVAYPAQFDTGLGYGRHVVAEVSMGAVDFVPSREGLDPTPKTKATVAAIGGDVSMATKEVVQKMIENAATHREAFSIYLDNRDLLKSITGLMFKGTQLPLQFATSEFVLTAAHSRRPGAHSVYKELLMESAMKSMFVTNYAPQKFTAPHKRRLLQYCEENDLDVPEFFALTRDPSVDLTWVGGAHVVDWSVIKAIKLPRAENARSGRPLGSYDVRTGDGYITQIQAADLDPSEHTIMYQVANRANGYDTFMVLKESYPNLHLVELPYTRAAKFKRLFPAATEVQEALQERYDKWAAKLTLDQKTALEIYDESLRWCYEELQSVEIDDPDLQKAVRLSKIDLNDVIDSRRMLHNVGLRFETGVTWEDPLAKYTLLRDRYGSFRLPTHDPHLPIYLNAAYAAMNAQEAS